MTIEDPVEYVFPSINQIQTNEQAGLTFATGLKSILRQDPDVILVGEIRDVETARIAIQSALTGHFVLSSLHATDAVAALHRFLDMGIESFLIASSVVGVVGQRLVRRICTHCKEPYTPSDEELAFYAEAAAARRPISTRAPAATSAPAPATATASASTSCCASRPRSSASSSVGPPRKSSAGWPSPKACARCRTKRWRSSRPTSPPSPKSSARSTRSEVETMSNSYRDNRQVGTATAPLSTCTRRTPTRTR